MNNDERCPFCYELKRTKENDAYYRQDERYTEKYTAAFVAEKYFEGEPSGNTKHCGYELNFCPACGKALSGSK